MKNISGNCSIPFGLFGSDAPEHVITAIEIIDNEFIVTGDTNGQIIIWKINSLVDIIIHWYLLGHSDKILNICNLSVLETEDKNFVTFSNKREIAVWNCRDGRCLKFDRNIAYDHLYVLSYKSVSRVSKILLCCGKYPGILVLDSLTLVAIMHLKSRGYPNWVQSLCVFDHQQAGVHVVLGLSVTGAAILWTIEALDTSKELQIVYETESKMLLLTSPVSISMCPAKPRFVLVISSCAAHIYDAASWILLFQTTAVDSCFVTGRYLDARTVLMQSKSGNMHLYRIPLPLDTLRDTASDFPMELGDWGSLGCLAETSLCHSVLVNQDELTVVSGGETGTINLWRSHMSRDDHETANDNICTSLFFSLDEQWTQKKFPSIVDPLSHMWKVTCCHYTRSINCLVLGMDNGDIVVTDMLHTVCATLFPKHTSSLQHTVLNGHTATVLSLLYAETVPDENKNPYKWLWSGSADFSVRLWDFKARSCVRIFHCHSGPVRFLVKGPMLGLTRSKHEGHIKAHKNKENGAEQEVLRPINSGSWVGSHLFVSLDDDNGIAFLSLDTKSLVLQMKFFSEVISVRWRREHIVAVIECADGSVTLWELGTAEIDRCVMGQLAKDLLESCSDATYFQHVTLVPPTRASSLPDRLNKKCGSSLTLHSVSSGLNILVVDTEALLVDLYRPRLVDSGGPPRVFVEAQLLLALVNQWGSDTSLDKTLEVTLGLISTISISGGHTSSRFGTMSFLLSAGDHNTAAVISSQRLLAGVAVCHALNNLPEKYVQYPWSKLSKYLAGMQTFTSSTSADTNTDTRTSMRQVCCLLATSLVTFSLPRILRQDDGTPFSTTRPLCAPHVQLVMQQFLQKYQDRCLEIRESANTLFHSAMDCLTSEQRTEIVQSWVLQSKLLDLANDDEISISHDKSKQFHRCSLSSVYDLPVISDWRSGWPLVQLYDPLEIAHIQVITVAFLAAVGSRYGSLDLRSTSGSNTVSPIMSKAVHPDKTIPGFGIGDYQLARITCGHLMRLIGRSPLGTTQWPEMRRLAITLLGQGFPVWEPYLEVGTLFGKLLEIVAGAEKVMSGWSQGQLLSDDMDAARSARSALLAIALSRPKVFATVLSIEVLRLQMQSSPNVASTAAQMGNGVAAVAATRAAPAPASSQVSQPPLVAARHEVVEVIKVLCERKTREMHEVFPEIMDVLLACLNKLELRQYDLQQLFPPILLFRIASSHTASGKVCVGTRAGHVVFYDVKLGKYNSSPGHKSAVTSVTFSPDGKQVASYSMPDNSVCIWQLSSSGLFGMGSSHQVRLASTLNVPPVAVSHTVSEEDSGLLLWLEWYENRSIHLVTTAGLVNKIKL